MNREAKPTVDKEKIKKARAAFKFAADLKAIATPKKTVIISLKQNYGLSTHDARAVYRTS